VLPCIPSVISFLTMKQVTGLFLPHKGYDDGYFFGSIMLITLTLLYVIIICPESKKPAAQAERTQVRESLSFKVSPLLATRNLFLNFLTSLMLPISMFTPRPIPGTTRKNYNMTYVGLSLFLYIVSTVRTRNITTLPKP